VDVLKKVDGPRGFPMKLEWLSLNNGLGVKHPVSWKSKQPTGKFRFPTLSTREENVSIRISTLNSNREIHHLFRFVVDLNGNIVYLYRDVGGVPNLLLDHSLRPW
jgi:hypothetical protein